MKLFKKVSNSEPAEVVETQPVPVEQVPETNSGRLSPLEVVRSVFKTRFGEDMPEDMASLFKNLAKNEAQLLVNSFNRLDVQEVEKTKEALHLTDTRRKNLIHTISQINSQLEWYEDFVSKTRDLNDKKKVLYEAQNAMAESYTEAQLLERFDALSPIQVLYYEIQNLESDLRDQENKRGELAAEVDEWTKAVGQKNKQYDDALQNYKSVEQDMEGKLILLRTNYELNGRTDQLQKEIMDSQLIQQQLSLNLKEARKRELECKTQLSHLAEQCQKADDVLQTLEPNQQMLIHGEMILVKLDNLNSLKFAVDADQKQYDEWQSKQSDSNETLNRLFRENQENESELQTAKSEMAVHQQSIKGIDGFSLQKRVSELTGQALRLKTAQQVWKRISVGYDFIESKKDEIMRQQLQFDNQTDMLAQMQQKVLKLTSIYNEQNYASTLSKSENVTSLRRDLREGSSCSVCGATHHPYHSETEQALNELVNNLEEESKQSLADLAVEKANLLKMQLQHSREEGVLLKNKEMLDNAILQNESDKSAWAEFSNLDSTFADCSPSVNRETRKIMIQQLVERTSQDLEDARKELDLFNYHQASINNMVDHIEVLEGKKRDNSVRLTEVNTACQVLANNTDFMQKTLSSRKSDYHQLYEDLSRLITLPGWHAEWLQNSETCKIRLQTMMSEWEQNRRFKSVCKEEEKLQTGILDTLGEFIKLSDAQLTQITQSLEAMEETLSEEQSSMRRNLGEMPLDDALSTLMENLRNSMQDMVDVRQQLTDSQHTMDLLEGRMQEQNNLRVEKEKLLVKKRSELDLWLRKFNASNAPAQLSELKRLFVSENNWAELRQRIGEIKKRVFLAEHDVEESRRQLSEHQAKSLRPDDSDEESRDALNFRKDKLQSELEDVYLQHATLASRLESDRLSHERAEQYEKNIERSFK